VSFLTVFAGNHSLGLFCVCIFIKFAVWFDRMHRGRASRPWKTIVYQWSRLWLFDFSRHTAVGIAAEEWGPRHRRGFLRFGRSQRELLWWEVRWIGTGFFRASCVGLRGRSVLTLPSSAWTLHCRLCRCSWFPPPTGREADRRKALFILDVRWCFRGRRRAVLQVGGVRKGIEICCDCPFEVGP
jgi:hypothetical protein